VRIATVQWRDGTSAALVLDDDHAAPVRALAGRDDAEDALALIRRPLTAGELERLATLGEPLDGMTLAPPIPRPPKNVICVGKNFAEHVAEGARAMGVDPVIPTAPIWFTKAHTALLGCGGATRLDPAFTRTLDYEGELTVVIGRAGRGIDRSRALEHVYGYTILCDLTARDRQQLHGQWFKGKSADGFAPCGPWIVTRDEVPALEDLRIRTTVDGEVRQDGRVGDMLFDVATLIADVSEGLTLEPGDLIATGTPSGVAWGSDDERYLSDGQVVAIEIDGIGRLWSTVAEIAPGG
jgi:2-keto-4-pentenoate hydratase/2-oxohepta-3-ene-1,7-dioic acid hydratase in catechol pathway